MRRVQAPLLELCARVRAASIIHVGEYAERFLCILTGNSPANALKASCLPLLSCPVLGPQGAHNYPE